MDLVRGDVSENGISSIFKVKIHKGRNMIAAG
jgi:hypothetical protein